METSIYRVNPTGYYGTDSLVASALDAVLLNVRGNTDRLVTIWANNDSGSYTLFWTLDSLLLDFDGIPFDVDEVIQNPQMYADQILASVDANKNNVSPE